MRYGSPWRRPKVRSLALIYDKGWEAPAGAQSPFQPARERGDDTRHWLWQQGAEDRAKARLIEELI